MTRKRVKGVIGFSNERFLKLVSDAIGIVPVGELGRETPLDLSSLEAARGTLLIREMYSKYDDGKPSPEKERMTWERFHAAEKSCEEANKRIRAWSWNSEPFWLQVRARIRDVLGPFSWDECSRGFGFGPGATTRLTRAEAFAAYKYSGKPETTLGNADLARCAIEHLPLWKQSVRSTCGEGDDDIVNIVVGNSIICVRKNYRTDRTIAKEPCMNIYVQKGVGKMVRRRLKRVGVDLDDQTRNQRAARKGSIDGSSATVDKTMASDTNAKELVGWLLPLDWWQAMELCRSPVGVLPSGEVIHYQKFSSMGNGYTFELESLIFWAIAQTCCCPDNINECDPSVCVYGDDVVLPTHAAGYYMYRVKEAGFTPNPDKTFVDGPYRESCGKHYYLGTDITPFYVRKPVEHLHRLFLTHNNLYRWLERAEMQRDDLLTQVRALAPAKWREPRLPDGYGDGAFIGPVDSLRLDPHPHGWEYWQVKALDRCQDDLSAYELPFGQLIASLLASVTAVTKDSALKKVGLSESASGLPARAGKYREIKLLIPRRDRKSVV